MSPKHPKQVLTSFWCSRPLQADARGVGSVSLGTSQLSGCAYRVVLELSSPKSWTLPIGAQSSDSLLSESLSTHKRVT